MKTTPPCPREYALAATHRHARYVGTTTVHSKRASIGAFPGPLRER